MGSELEEGSKSRGIVSAILEHVRAARGLRAQCVPGRVLFESIAVMVLWSWPFDMVVPVVNRSRGWTCGSWPEAWWMVDTVVEGSMTARCCIQGVYHEVTAWPELTCDCRRRAIGPVPPWYYLIRPKTFEQEIRSWVQIENVNVPPRCHICAWSVVSPVSAWDFGCTTSSWSYSRYGSRGVWRYKPSRFRAGQQVTQPRGLHAPSGDRGWVLFWDVGCIVRCIALVSSFLPKQKFCSSRKACVLQRPGALHHLPLEAMGLCGIGTFRVSDGGGAWAGVRWERDGRTQCWLWNFNHCAAFNIMADWEKMSFINKLPS